MKNGRRSIYLDCYRNGHRSYEYLKLYLVPETDDKSLRLNEATMRKAETACRKKLRELKKLPAENRRLMETQGYISNKGISYWSGFLVLRRYSVAMVYMISML